MPIARIRSSPGQDGPLPPGVRYAAVPPLASPFRVSRIRNIWLVSAPAGGNLTAFTTRRTAAEHAVASYTAHIRAVLADNPAFLEPLAGITALACSCPLQLPCHADVLIEMLERQPPAMSHIPQQGDLYLAKEPSHTRSLTATHGGNRS